jgi:hypothetical protein
MKYAYTVKELRQLMNLPVPFPLRQLKPREIQLPEFDLTEEKDESGGPNHCNEL